MSNGAGHSGGDDDDGREDGLSFPDHGQTPEQQDSWVYKRGGLYR